VHVTGAWAAVGAVITGLIIADILYHWQGANALLRTGGGVATQESSLLAGRRA
jgi:hypothetical protein